MHYGQNVSDRCGGHIHIGADYLTMEESWKNLTEIWGNTEQILYTISNKAGEIPRVGVPRYASPISSDFENILNSGNVNLQSEEDLKSFVKKAQSNNRYYGINFMNLENSKNTIEFRLPNGTLDADTWIQNINLFGGIIRISENLAIIQTKPEEERTEEEIKMLQQFEILKNSEISDKEKLEALLAIVITEEHRDIYRERYEVNSQLIEQNPEIKRGITEKVAKSPIDIKKVGKKVFTGADGITGQEYNQISQDIERAQQMENSDIIL